MIAIYPGSFDPITRGHLDVIERGCRLFEQVIVVVFQNPSKTPLFPVPQRIDQIRRSTQHLSNLEVDSFDGLTVTYARMRQAKVLLRGLRAVSDFEMELQMAHTNKTLANDIETVFLATSTEHSFLSSSVVKEIARFGGPVDHLVPQAVALDICKCYAKTPIASAPTAEELTRMEPPPLEAPPRATPPEAATAEAPRIDLPRTPPASVE
ncbi:MAG: pantetheine-phosphate adenylyltransferase [Elainella sp.]